MKTSHISILAALLAAIPSASAILVPVDLGDPRRTRGERDFAFTALNGLSLDGQTLSIDYSFGSSFIRILEQTNRWFICLPMVQTNVAGTIYLPGGTAYTVGADGLPNSPVWTFPAGSTISDTPDELLNFGLGYIFPLVTVIDGSQGLYTYQEGGMGIYGIHFELNLPDFPGGEITSGYLRLSPNGDDRSGNTYAVGAHVPDGGSTAWLFGAAGLALLGLHSLAKRHHAHLSR